MVRRYYYYETRDRQPLKSCLSWLNVSLLRGIFDQRRFFEIDEFVIAFMKDFNRWIRLTFWVRFFGIIANGQHLLDIIELLRR